MALTVSHTFVSTGAQTTSTSLVSKNEWNATHSVSGTVEATDVNGTFSSTAITGTFSTTTIVGTFGSSSITLFPGTDGSVLYTTGTSVGASSNLKFTPGTGDFTLQALSGPQFNIARFGNTAVADGDWVFQKSRGTLVTSHVIVQTDDQLGTLRWQGSNGTAFQDAASIIGYVDGAPGAGTDMPGRLVFNTSPDGTAAAIERMRIASDGLVTFSKGATFTAYNGGTVSSGTYTPSVNNSNYQFYTNNGAHTLAAPTSDCAIDILITNGASAGTITSSGYTLPASPGDALTTTNGSKFMVSIRRVNSVATYSVYALQ